jgi:ribosomal protein S18 acetylase RimI-like enzyme
MTTTSLTTVRPVDGPRAIATLVAAFETDPVLRWFFPEPDLYREHFPSVLQLFGGEDLATATVDCTTAYEGAAIWLAPDAEIDEEAVGGLVEQAVAAERLEDVFAFLGQMDEHHLREEHWYLPFIGVDPAHQGQGHGSTLLRQALGRCDRDQLPAYLEASTPRNRALYERHGFVVTAEIRVADSPPLWPMRRLPR